MLNYFNPETKTLTLPYDFNEKLENLPEGITKIIFEGDYYFDCSIFNQPISQNTLPTNLTHLTYYSTSKLDNIPMSVDTVKIYFCEDDKYNVNIGNLPITIKKIIVNIMSKKDYIKIPFGCEIVEEKSIF